MSKDELQLEIKKGNQPLIKTVVGLSIGGILSLFTCTFYLGGIYRDFRDTQEWKTTAAPKIEKHETQIAIINDRLKIR